MTVREEKAALRREIRALAAALAPDELRRAGQAMAAQLTALPEYVRAGTVFAFVSTPQEADTRPLLERVLRDGKRLAVPLCVGPGQMQCRLITDLGVLRPGAFGIPEPPESSPLLDAGAVELAVVPCLACDRAGRRLGHGGGYYDRFLASYTGPAAVLCPQKLLWPAIPQEPLDKPVPLVVTETAVFRPGRTDRGQTI